MGRIRRFQRTMLTGLAGINTFVFGTANGASTVTALLWCAMAMTAILIIILAYSKTRNIYRKKTLKALKASK